MNRCYEIYIYANRILGNERVHVPPSMFSRGFDKVFPLVRDQNRITIVTNDKTLGEPEARQFADAILRGEYTVYHASFDQINADKNLGKTPKKNGTR